MTATLTRADVASMPKWRRDKEAKMRRVRDLERGIDHSLTDATQVRTHLTNLHHLGFSMRAIGAGRGVSEHLVQDILNGRYPNMRGAVVHEWLKVTPQHLFATAPAPASVPTFAAQRRTQALQALGHSRTVIEEVTLEQTGVTLWCRVIGRDPRMSAERHRALASVYEGLSARPGRSEQVRSRARGLGYAPPLAWDDIDDPGAVPDVGRRPKAGADLNELLFLVRGGVHPESAASRLGVTIRAIERAARRHDRVDVLTAIGIEVAA